MAHPSTNDAPSGAWRQLAWRWDWWLLAATLVIAPWLYGAVRADVLRWLALPLGAALLVALVRQARGRVAPADGLRVGVLFHLAAALLLLALLFGAFQLVPLPAGLCRVLSPGAAAWRDQLLPETANQSLGPHVGLPMAAPPSYLTLYPAATRRDLAHLVLGASVLVLGGLAIRSRVTRIGLLLVLAVNGAALAFFGLVQQLSVWWTGPGEGGGTPFASFVNRNNAAGYLNLCLAAALGLAVYTLAAWYQERHGWLPSDSAYQGRGYRAPRGRRAGQWITELIRGLDAPQLGSLLLCGLIAAGVLCTLSRGGILAFAGALLVTAVAAGVANRRAPPWHLLGLGLAALLGLGLVLWVGRTQALTDRLATLLEMEPHLQSGRVPNWRDAIGAAGQTWLTGSGLGTYRYLYASHELRANPSWHYHAENQYIEAWVDAGVWGVLLILALIACVARTTWQLLRAGGGRGTQALAIAGLFALTSQALHALFDFGLYVPANMMALAALCGAVLAAAGGRRDRSSHRQRAPGGQRPVPQPARERRIQLALLGLLLAGTCWSFAELQGLAAIERASQAANIPQEPNAASQQTLAAASATLEAALDRRPDDAEAHRQLANLHIHHYRQAVVDLLRLDESLASLDQQTLWRFSSPLQAHGRAHAFAQTGQPEALQLLRDEPLVQQFLLPALRHALLARQACPLLPRVHLQIAQLCVLVVEPAADEVHIQRAQRLAPGNPGLLMICGLLHLNAQRPQQAHACWQTSLALSPQYQQQIITAAKGRVSPQELVEQVFPSDPRRLVQLANRYLNAPDQKPWRKRALQRAINELNQRAAADAQACVLRGRIYQQLGQQDKAIQQYQQAIRQGAVDLDARYQLAQLLLARGDAEQARQHARWCVRACAPDSHAYRDLLKRIHQMRLRGDGKRVTGDG